jgi:hypothetical protein
MEQDCKFSLQNFEFYLPSEEEPFHGKYVYLSFSLLPLTVNYISVHTVLIFLEYTTLHLTIFFLFFFLGDDDNLHEFFRRPDNILSHNGIISNSLQIYIFTILQHTYFYTFLLICITNLWKKHN